MKKLNLLLIALLLLFTNSVYSQIVKTKSNSSMRGELKVYCTSDLYKLTKQWVLEFSNLNPDVNTKIIKIKQDDESSVTKILNMGENIGFVSNKYYSDLNENAVKKIVIARDVIVPVINSKNPFLNEIYKQGITTENLAKLFLNTEMKWANLLNNSGNSPVNFYQINNNILNSEVADFLKVNENSINKEAVLTAEEFVSFIQKDPYAIGFCKMADIIDLSNQNIVKNIKLLPIDRNGNGELDYMENFYENSENFCRGVWIGKYPQQLFNNFYAAFPLKSSKDVDLAFMKWVLTSGQKFVNYAGYTELTLNERQKKLDIINDSSMKTITSNDEYASVGLSLSKKIILLMMVCFFALFIVIAGTQFLSKGKLSIHSVTAMLPGVFNIDSVKVPAGLYYDKTHTWAFMESNGMVKIGIDDFLQHITGSITRVNLKNPGDKVRKGDHLLTIIQNGKQLNIYSPVSGTIKTQNQMLTSNSSIINSSPYTDGWVYSIEPTNWLREIQFLIMEKKYKDLLKNEFSRLKDFLIETTKLTSNNQVQTILQDGGELKDNILANLGPEIWEDFQTKFIDIAR